MSAVSRHGHLNDFISALLRFGVSGRERVSVVRWWLIGEISMYYEVVCDVIPFPIVASPVVPISPGVFCDCVFSQCLFVYQNGDRQSA